MYGWVFFRVEEFSNAIHYLKKMTSIGDSSEVTIYAAEYLDNKTIVILIIAILYSFKFFRKGTELVRYQFIKSNKKESFQFIYETSKFIICSVLFSLSIMYLSASTYNPFIYFRF